MNGLSVRQPLRLAARVTSRDRSSSTPWTCHSCRIHAAAQTSVNATHQKSNGHRRKHMPLPSLRHASSAASPVRPTQTIAEDFPEDAPSAEASVEEESVESLRGIFEMGLAHRDQLELEDTRDTYGLVEALILDDPDRLKAAISQAAEDHSYITSIPKSTWTEIMRRLEPGKIVPRYHRIHRSFSARQLRQADVDPLEKRRKYMETLVRIIRIRREHGIRLGIVDYRLLLQYAARTGNEHAAKVLWADMHRDSVNPDVLCYNAYMEAIVWDEGSRLRQMRRARSPWHWNGPKPSDILLFKRGASVLVTKVFQEMVSRKVSGNTATFCVLITALARDGELQGAESIISKVWGVNVKALMETDKLVPTKHTLRPDSPTYPDQRLLVTIAEIYGAANQIPGGLRLIDHLARYYNLKVSNNVWYQISRWTWLQARVRDQERLQPNEWRMGFSTVQRLSNIMAAAPYQINPSMAHLDILFKSIGSELGKTDERPITARLLEILELGRAKYVRRVKFHQEAAYQYQRALDRPSISTAPRKSIYRLRHTAEQALVNKRLAQQLMQRWCRALISLKWLPSTPAPGPLRERLSAWRLRDMPRFLLNNRPLIPSTVRYRIETGLVELLFRTQDEVDHDKAQKPIADRRRRRRLKSYTMESLSVIGKQD